MCRLRNAEETFRITGFYPVREKVGDQGRRGWVEKGRREGRKHVSFDIYFREKELICPAIFSRVTGRPSEAFVKSRMLIVVALFPSQDSDQY